MNFIGIYFILGLAMFLVAIWDYKLLPRTSNRLVRKPSGETGFSLIVLSVRNLTVMAFFSFFLWPIVVVMELSGNGEK
jgi:hypothetical protein